MSIKFYCDICKKEIKKSTERVTITIQEYDGGEKKCIKHACPTCFTHKVKDLFKEVKETKSTEEALTEHYGTLKKDTVHNDIIINLESVGEREFNKPRIKGISKYFTLHSCYYIHRFNLLGSKVIKISERVRIPYQSVKNYVSELELNIDGSYLPETEFKDLVKIEERIKNDIPKIKALLATCTWSFKDVADETNHPVEDIETFFRDLPWFEYRLNKND